MNPSGGLLGEGYLHGMNHVADAVWQLQNRAGPTQVQACRRVMVVSGGVMCGAAVILERDAGPSP